MKNKDIDKFREELNDDIDKIIEEDKSEKEGTFFKPSHLFLTISLIYHILLDQSFHKLLFFSNPEKYLVYHKYDK